MNTFITSNKTTQELCLKQFMIRKTAKLCTCFVCFIQILYRLAVILWDPSQTPKSILMLQLSLPLCAMTIAIISLKSFLFKKKGSSVVKFSNITDCILLLLFVGDWIFFLLASLYKMEGMPSFSFPTPALFGYTAFSWRTLLVTLLVQKWQLKIIAPTIITAVVTGYAMYYCQYSFMFILSRTVMQLFNIIVIVYCQDKVASKLTRTNLEQEKWMQVNDFILDSIPEKIMILDLRGEVKFMSEYCKIYLEKFNLSLDTKEFFKRVGNLKQLLQDKFDSTTKTTGDFESKVETLQDLITQFPHFTNLQEKQFFVFNGKFETKPHQLEKSLEIRISFVQHYNNPFLILILRDLTQRDLFVTLEETNKYKDQLLDSVSHELRAPLNGNINLVEGAINSSGISSYVKETLLIPALRSSKFLLHIINDIIDLSQIKQKKLRLVFHSEDLKETLKNTAQLIEFQAKQKGLDFFVEIDAKIPQNFHTDHMRVSQIVLNLLKNAVKFTNQGKIQLFALMVPGTSSVRIGFQDSGIGISPENIKKLFSSNPIMEGKEKRKSTGPCLGLNIASSLVEFLAPEDHKKISVFSVPNQGSLFTFVLENKSCEPKERASYKSSFETTEEMTFISQPKVSKEIQTLTSLSLSTSRFDSESLINPCSCPKVLIVDDNPFNTVALETILKSLKIKCESAYNGKSGIERLLSRQVNPCCENCKSYSVVFMDYEMPGTNGSETVKEIKKLQEQNKLPAEMRIIGCTALKVKEEVDKFLASGLESCIFKPVSVGMIKDKLKDLLD